MSMRKTLIALACMLPMTAAMACGPDFPQSLLDDRKASLLDLPEGTFAFEAGHLLTLPKDHLRLVEDPTTDDPDKARGDAEAPGLSAGELQKVQAMRAAPDAAAAATAGTGLAPELLEYTLGAIAFKQGDKQAAIAHFERVLALAPTDRPRRGLWAQFMLGRAQAASGNTDGAVAAFEVVRERALSGADDPLGLAIASFGEQARIAWHHGSVADSVKLYAEQAAHGSTSGGASLLFVARSILAHRELLDKALDDPLSQRLLAAYFFTRSSEFAQDWPPAGTKLDPDAPGSADAHKSSTSVDINDFIAAVQQHGLDHFEGADRMAAGTYDGGHYDLATRLAAKSTSPLAAWVRAKLALRAGDQTAALREYAVAAHGFPADESWSGDAGEEVVEAAAVNHPLCRVETERGVLALGRGDYLDAMARMFAGSSEYWPDAAYVAERVLTVDELKTFVDGNAPAPARPLPKKDQGQSTPAMQLRDLLARRLMRSGRLQEALAYFDDPALRKKAQALIDAHHDDHAWLPVTRAAALFKQAQIIRNDGLELFGAELAPDNAEWGGEYPPQDLPSTKGKEFVGSTEAALVAASAAQPDARYHYRYIASNLAEHAAGLVPARSQAYAAMMCQSTAWMLDTDQASAVRIYRRYVQHGAHVKWARNFGSTCQQPDFQSAKWLPLKQGWWQTRHWVRREWWLVLLTVGAATALFAWRRRRRTAN